VVVIPINDEDSERVVGASDVSAKDTEKCTKSEQTSNSLDESDSKFVDGSSSEVHIPVDWNHTAKLAEEISQNFNEDAENEDNSQEAFVTGDSHSKTWFSGEKKKWPPAQEVDAFASAADIHKESIEEDDDEVVSFEKSTEVGVMHGDQIERKDFVKMQLELERLTSELNTAKEQVKENYELAQRKQAELANYKRRSKQDMDDFKKRATENLLVDLVPVLDSLDKAVLSIPKDADGSPLFDGIRRTLALFVSILTRYNVKVISDVNVPFDPSIHACLLFEDTDEFEENTVLEIYQNGYTLCDRLIRPSMVKLSRKLDPNSKVLDATEATKSSDETSDDTTSSSSINEVDTQH